MNTTETDEMTIFEKNGIRYEQRGDFLYPVLGACDNATITGVGKYGTLWMTWLFELDRRLQRKYLLEGTLIEKAMEFQEYACELENEIVNATGISLGSTDDYLSVLAQQRQRWEVAQEIITHDGRVAIMKNKELREKEIKKRLRKRDMRELRIDGTLILAVDHGYGNIKTANTVFSNGFVERYRAGNEYRLFVLWR